MKIMNFFKNNINKYSFQSVCWVFTLQMTILGLFIQNLKYLEPFQYKILFLVLSFPIFLVPIMNSIYVWIYLFFKEKEKCSADFVIKNNFLTKNPIYLLFCIISFCIVVVWITSTTISSLYYIKDDFPTFIILTLPTLIVVFVLYLLARKFWVRR